MSWLVWNVQGLRNLRTIRELEVVTQAQVPSALFLAKTWVGEARLRRLCNELKFDHCWISPSAGKTGCLALFWKNTIKVVIMSSSPNHIDAIVRESLEVQWCFSGVYGFANKARKHET